MNQRATSLAFLATLGAAVAAASPLAGARRGDVSAPAPTPKSTTVAVRAGTIHTLESAGVLTGGATLIVRDGRIVAVGRDLPVPPDAQVVDYGPDATIAPGFVAASSPFGFGAPAERTADPRVRALDNYDPYSKAYAPELAAGVTTVYLAPARGRLIAGQGAVVKLAGRSADARVLRASASVQGSVAPDALDVPGYWEVPIPADSATGLGRAEPQLPGSLMGALTALRELVAFARGQADHAKLYGRDTGMVLSNLMRTGVPWRFVANSEPEIRVLARFAKEEKLPLVIDGGDDSGALAKDLAAIGAKVVLQPDFTPQRPGRDFGKERDTHWPNYDNAARLVEAGVGIAIATPDSVRPRDLRFAAALASRGGLSADAALRAITLGAAEVLGVSDRVGSLAPGKDADFIVTSGEPLDTTSGIIATWIDGESAGGLTGSESASERAASTLASAVGAGRTPRAVVLEVDDLHVGTGEVLSPAQVLIRDGRIAEVGRRVSHPAGAVVVRGAVAMPGMIDAAGFLGMDGASKAPNTDFKLTRIVSPGDYADEKVALAGVTTVVLVPRGDTRSGTPMMAYKPAAQDLERMVIKDPTALRLVWSDRNRLDSGKEVKALLAKAVEYDQKWKAYQEALAKWEAEAAKNPPPTSADAGKGDGKGDKEAGSKDDSSNEKKDEAKEDKKEDKKEEKSKDKKKDDAPEADPVSGIWEADATFPPQSEASHLRLRLELSDAKVEGSLRCDALSETLIELAGTFGEGEFAVRGLGSRGWVSVTGKPAKGAFKGRVSLGEEGVDIEAKRTSTELPRAARAEQRKPKQEEKPSEPKGKPKSPGVDAKLEPFREAIAGRTAVVVTVDWREEIRECVDAFEKAGITPVLFGADDATGMIDELKGRIAGVILSQRVLAQEPRGGLASEHNRYADLEAAGIPVAFQSGAEEGAAELPLLASYAIAHGMSPDGALRALCSNAAAIYRIDDRVGRLAVGLDGDVLLLDGPPLDPRTTVVRAWVNGQEVR